VGAGVWDVDLGASVGYSFSWGYVAASAGYQWRSSGFVDRVTWSAEAGGDLNARWTTRARASGVHALRTGDVPSVF